MIRTSRPHFDFLIVGAGYSGLVMAERICNVLGKTCLVIDRRPHIGGNCHDQLDAAGVLIHTYGPHYFRTDSERVKEYLSQFTGWIDANYVIKSYSDDRFWSFPINLNTFEELIGRPGTGEEFEAWLAQNRIPIPSPKNSEEFCLSRIGPQLYEKFFRGYTIKQWNKHPRELDPSVCGRIPIRTNRDNRYLTAKYQMMPKYGYTAMFENIIDACGDRLRIELDTDFFQVREKISHDFLIYTGPIDAFYKFRFGPLPYRSLRFERESFTPNDLHRLNRPTAPSGFWQPYVQVNYPNTEDFTRIVEVKHVTGQKTPNTTIVREYSTDPSPEQEPYYPIPNAENQGLYEKYAALTTLESRTLFLGRLATYKYYNMDQIVEAALQAFDDVISSNVQPSYAEVSV